MSQKIKKVICAATILTTCFGTVVSASAQDKVRRTAPDGVQIQKMKAEQDMLFNVTSDGGNFTFIAADNMFGGPLVKGAPYSAQAVTENIQTLSDGNRITRKNTTAVYRDGEGRTRNDQALGAIGPYAVQGDPAKTFFINDPIAGVQFVLEPTSKTARKMMMRTFDGPVLERRIAPTADSPETTVFIRQGEQAVIADKMAAEKLAVDKVRAENHVFVATADDARGVSGRFDVVLDGKSPNVKTESLGTQNIEGVSAEGSRTTVTIPAGEIGNELAINIVTETWFSPELKVLVLRKHSDPRNGEMIYRLTNINRSEPDHSLFEVPADYTVKENFMRDGVRLQVEKELVREKMKTKNDQ